MADARLLHRSFKLGRCEITLSRASAPTPARRETEKARRMAAFATTNPFAHLGGHDVAEAIILGDLLLERPRAR